ncbi:MAG: hypothetical protein KGL90_09040 [Burkholderiales bacterium]|nr:hypothetical protein [Burkholderiales bacterium]
MAAAWLPGCATRSDDHKEAGGATNATSGVASPPAGGAKPRSSPSARLAAPASPRNWADARLQAARRLVAANPDITYTGRPPDLLMAIPVMTVDLNGDGSIRHIEVMRYPSQARETVDIAINAIRRAAPFGDVSRLPKPWRFNETFLFNNEHKFKPMTLDRL